MARFSQGVIGHASPVPKDDKLNNRLHQQVYRMAPPYAARILADQFVFALLTFRAYYNCVHCKCHLSGLSAEIGRTQIS